VTNAYRAVQWNRHKKVYDLLIAGGVLGYLLLFFVGGRLLFPPPDDFSDEILLIRAFGTCAILLLHLILAIGPLARLDARFAPLLYNRRHLGVSFFLVALAHALLVLGFYGGFGVQPAPAAVLAGYPADVRDGALPFEVFGFFALLIFFLMAATSHDFWLANLGAGTWKALHMLVYPAYALVVAHVAFGALQDQVSPFFAGLLALGVVSLSALHLAAGLREARRRPAPAPADAAASAARAEAAWLDAGPVTAWREGRGRAVEVPGAERVAIFRHQGAFHAVSNVCAHQAGPLGEGRVVDGCITCPWHGYQYLPGNGQSPPPFTEKIPTYRLRVAAGRVLLDPRPLPPGTPVTPAAVPAEEV
jgi:nitrite reductase/ring-hydroxylating ferredoxin subunit/DMSO/TMAO reductase YedYZ heme-binding membrane subunit